MADGEDESYFPDERVEGIDEDPTEKDDKLTSLSPVPSSSEEEEEESRSYEGPTGNTPPSGGRYLKTSRRGHKHKTSKKIHSSVSKGREIARAKSADWSESVTPHDSLTNKRNSLPGETDGVDDTDSGHVPVTCGILDEKKRKEKSRQKERNVKTALIHPEMSTSPSNTVNDYTDRVPPHPSFSSPPPPSHSPDYPSLIHSHSCPPPPSHSRTSPLPPPQSPLTQSHPSPPSHPHLPPPSHPHLPHSSHTPASLQSPHKSPSSQQLNYPPNPTTHQSPPPPYPLPPPDPHYDALSFSLYPLPSSTSPSVPYASRLSSSPHPTKPSNPSFVTSPISPHIPSHMRPAFSYTTDNINPFYSLSSVPQTMYSSKIERSHSDAQLSLTLSSSQSMHCPPDRKQFYRSFAKSLKIIAKRQQQPALPPTHIPRQHSEDLNARNPWALDNEQLRMELRAYLNNQTVEDQEESDYQLQCEVGRTLYRITNYCFSADSTMDGYFRGMNEPTMSLPARLNELKGGANERVKKRGTVQGIKEEEEGEEEEEEGRDDDETPLTSITNNTGVSWKDGCPDDDDDDDDEYGPQTLTQQQSRESEGSSVEYRIDQFLNEDQMEALEEVNNLLLSLERVELLYTSSKRITDKQYHQLPFKRRRAALILWSKITEGLANHLVHLSKWFGVIVNPVTRSEGEITPPGTSGVPSRQGSDGSGGLPPPLPPPVFGNELSVDPEESLSLSVLSLASSLFQTQNSVTSSRGTLQRLFSSRNILSIEEERVSSKGYSRFVDQVLKRKSLDWLIEKIIKSIKPILKTAKEAMKQQQAEEEEEEEEEEEAKEDDESDNENIVSGRRSLFYPLHLGRGGGRGGGISAIKRASSIAPKCWMDEFIDMNLPSFAEQVSYKLYIMEWLSFVTFLFSDSIFV